MNPQMIMQILTQMGLPPQAIQAAIQAIQANPQLIPMILQQMMGGQGGGMPPGGGGMPPGMPQGMPPGMPMPGGGMPPGGYDEGEGGGGPSDEEELAETQRNMGASPPGGAGY